MGGFWRFQIQVLEGFWTLFFSGGGGVTPIIPMELCGGKKYFVEPGRSQTWAKRGVSGGFKPRFRGFLGVFEM